MLIYSLLREKRGWKLTGSSFVADPDEPTEQGRFLSDVAGEVRAGEVIATGLLLKFWLGHLRITCSGA